MWDIILRIQGLLIFVFLVPVVQFLLSQHDTKPFTLDNSDSLSWFILVFIYFESKVHGLHSIFWFVLSTLEICRFS